MLDFKNSRALFFCGKLADGEGSEHRVRVIVTLCLSFVSCAGIEEAADVFVSTWFFLTMCHDFFF